MDTLDKIFDDDKNPMDMGQELDEYINTCSKFKLNSGNSEA